jgi:hypothetical protein
MSKVSGSYESVVRGVSEQVSQDRRSGQHYEQINMISDPVNGLSRRHGSQLLDEKIVANYVPATHAKWLVDTARHRVFPFYVAGSQYDLIYRTAADTQSLGNTTFAWAFNKTTGKFIPVNIDPTAAGLVAGGVSSIVNVGKYLFIAGNSIVPTYAATDRWGAQANKQKLAVWIRGGDYSRTYTVTVTKTNDTKITFSYKTKAASYQGLLDTSDILSSDPQYQKKVNDRVNAYNAEVTAYIGIAAADIAPENIATKLMAAAVVAGISAGSMSVTNGTLCIDAADCKEVGCDDSGDGTLIMGVGNEVGNIDKVSIIHYAGKIVKVRPKKNSGKDALYLKAIPKNSATTGWAEVTWREVAGYEMLPVAPFCIATVRTVGGEEAFYLAGTPTALATMSGDSTPQFKVNEVGDDITSPLPYFVGKTITYLGLFQDRLVIGSGAVLFFSRPGDYFNWFRQSVLNVLDDDPVEMYALGSEDDVIRHSAEFDKNLVLFGERKQYAINGRQRISTANVVFVLSAHENAIDAPPKNSGNFVFYTKTRNNITSAHQIQIGTLADTPESYQISQQLDRYIKGKGVEFVCVTSPNNTFIRTEDSRNTLYVYSYLDTATASERIFDSWSKWTWSEHLGQIVGLSSKAGDVLTYLLRKGKDKDGNYKVWIAADKFVLDTGLSPYPYMDSLRPTYTVLTPTANSFINPNSGDFSSEVYMAFGEGSPYRLLGTDMTNATMFTSQYPTAAADTYAGLKFDAYVTPTNPYTRDRNGKAIVIGRLTLGRLSIAVSKTSGLKVTVSSASGERVVQDFSGRVLGRATNLVGRQPIVTHVVPASIGKEVRECTYTLSAKTFLPLTITAIAWVGQYFNNTRGV